MSINKGINTDVVHIYNEYYCYVEEEMNRDGEMCDEDGHIDRPYLKEKQI